MARVKEPVNWSAVAAEAFELKLGEIARNRREIGGSYESPTIALDMSRDTAMQLARVIRQTFGDDPIETALKALAIDAAARHGELVEILRSGATVEPLVRLFKIAVGAT